MSPALDLGPKRIALRAFFTPASCVPGRAAKRFLDYRTLRIRTTPDPTAPSFSRREVEIKRVVA